MYGVERPRLFFPRVVPLGQEIKSANGPVPLYRLGWEQFDLALAAPTVPATGLVTPRPQTRPSLLCAPRKTWLDMLIYAVPQHYRVEIRRCCREAVAERERHLPFPKQIKDQMHRSTEALVHMALFLAADCLYDTMANRYSRGPDRCVVLPCLLLRFWEHQVTTPNGALDLCGAVYNEPLVGRNAAEQEIFASLRAEVTQRRLEMQQTQNTNGKDI